MDAAFQFSLQFILLLLYILTFIADYVSRTSITVHAMDSGDDKGNIQN